MSIESTIDSQYDAYHQLSYEHEKTRREQQKELLEPLQRLSLDVNNALVNDKRTYENAKALFYQKFNLIKRVLTPAASKYKNSSLEPLKHLYHRRQDLASKVNELVNETTLESTSREVRTHWNGSIAVVYNPITGRAEWRQNWHGGIHGVFNPITRTVEWQDEVQTGVYGVFNPKLNIVEWKKFYQGGAHGVYNPSTGTIEWQTSFHSGIGGVYNPFTKQIEWKTCLKGGVVGYFDYESQTVKWIEKWHHGLALIVWDSTLNTYLTTASCGWYGDQ